MSQMMPGGAAVHRPQQEDTLEHLATQLADLRDLFQRRLMEDKAKNQLIQSVQQSLEARDAHDRGEIFRSVFLDILLAVDRLNNESPSEMLNRSVCAELIESMARCGLQQLPATGPVDTTIHEVVGTVLQTADETDGWIAEVRRPGYALAGRVLRPAQVMMTVLPGSEPSQQAAVGKDQ